MAADDSLTARKPQASNVIRLDIERVKGGEDKGAGLGRHLSAADQLRRVSKISSKIHSRSWLGSPADPAGYVM